MIKIILPFLLLFIGIKNIQAQVPNLVISEIMYNPPESGTDSLEYIEIYNNENTEVNLLGINFSEGLTHTFPNLTLSPNSFIVIAKDSVAFQNTFGTIAFQWEAGTLSNNGEDLEIQTANGDVIDFVTYGSTAPWSTAANGLGASLVLCDYDSDNNATTNWNASTTSTGIVINNQELICNPNADSDCPTGPVISFLGNDLSFPEEAITIDLQIAIENGNTNPTTISLFVSPSSTANLNSDYTLASVTPINIIFPAGLEKDTQTITVQILEDLNIEPNEVLIFTLNNPNNNAITNPMHDVFQITIEDDDATLPDLIISEIMYNPPESGTDTTEFIELYNNDTLAINLVDYYFSEGINYTFPEIILNPNEYIVIARDSNAFEDYYGFTTYQWSSGSLTNSGELIELRNAGGTVADVVEYSNTAQWSLAANGNGASLTLCDFDADNSLPENWNASIAPTGIIIDGIELTADPNMQSDCFIPLSAFPIRAIGAMTTTDSDGILDSLNRKCELQGIVYGGNFNSSNNGLQFVLLDGNDDGITVFSNSDMFGYTVEEGDEVIVQGTITQFNGLAEIRPDTLWVVSNNNTLTIPNTVTTLDESTESQLINIENLSIVDTSDWDNSSSNGFTVEVTDGINFYDMRIDDDVDLYQMDVPLFSFNLTGLGGQFDTDVPYLEGYQILPRYFEDLEMITSTEELNIDATIDLFPNPVSDFLNIKMVELANQLIIRNALGQVVYTLQQPDYWEEINCHDWESGVYFVTISYEERESTFRILKF